MGRVERQVAFRAGPHQWRTRKLRRLRLAGGGRGDGKKSLLRDKSFLPEGHRFRGLDQKGRGPSLPRATFLRPTGLISFAWRTGLGGSDETTLTLAVAVAAMTCGGMLATRAED